jgi:hypothetical protein
MTIHFQGAPWPKSLKRDIFWPSGPAVSYKKSENGRERICYIDGVESHKWSFRNL